MTTIPQRYITYAYALLLISITTFTSSSKVVAQDDLVEDSYASANLLYIEEFELAAGATMNKAVAEMQEWVKGYRETGEYKSVRLFFHHTGPKLAVYILLEPNSWQAIQDGQNKFFEANADLMDKPFNWSGHSDNLLTEIPVE
jgi:hypothetical protein